MMEKRDKRELYLLLDEAIERVLKGEDVRRVLADYPRYTRDLEPLLRTAIMTHNAADILPRPAFRRQAALDFQTAVRQMSVASKEKPTARQVKQAEEKAHPGFRRGLFGLGTAWSVGFAAFMAVLLSGTGVVAASTQSMPDSPLYSVKLATESVQLALTPSGVGKAELISKFNDRRVDEVVDMAEKDMAAEISVLNSRIENNMNQISEITGNNINQAGDANVMMSTFGTSAESGPAAAGVAPADNTVPPETMAPAPDSKGLLTASNTTTETTVTAPGPETTETNRNAVPPTVITVPTATDNNDRRYSEDNERSDGYERSSGPGDKWEKLEQFLSEKQYKNLVKLLKAYDRASDSLKPSILQSIKIIIQGYGLSMENEASIYSILGSYGLSMSDITE